MTRTRSVVVMIGDFEKLTATYILSAGCVKYFQNDDPPDEQRVENVKFLKKLLNFKL